MSTTTRVDFYVLPIADERARLKLACQLAEKAFLQPQSVCIFASSEQEARDLDMLLWTFRDRSFVPHEIHPATADPTTPVLIASGALPAEPRAVLINLAPAVPKGFEAYERVLEPLDGEATRRRQGRERFKTYRDRGITPETHNLSEP